MDDPWFWIIAFVEIDIMLMWIGAWILKQRAFDEKATRWHRRQLSEDRWIPEGADREARMGPRWEAQDEERRRRRDPFTTPAELREDSGNGTS